MKLIIRQFFIRFQMAVDAASGWILDELEEGNTVPQVSEYMNVERREDGQINMILFDI